jgi:O-antigen biosynthesis protein
MNVLIIGYVWPEPRSSAAGLRDWNLIEAFQSAGWKVFFASASKLNIHAKDLAAKGISIHSVQPNDSKFDLLIKELNPDFVVFDRFVTEEQFGWRVREFCPSAIRILDTQDLHFLRRGREEALKSNGTPDQIIHCQFDLLNNTLFRELGSIYRSDCTLILSSFELSLLRKRFNIPESLLFLYRFQYRDFPTSAGFHERKNFGMIGNFRHGPNRDAILWLKMELWPLIRNRIPKSEIHICGAYPPKDMMMLTNAEDGFYVSGPVENSFQFLEQFRINLAPLRFGAGIKGKISDGWWSGTPVVTTPIGAEGMTEEEEFGGAIADDAHLFAQAAEILYSNKSEWMKARENGYRILKNEYSKKENFQKLINQLLFLKKNINDLRRTNITGAILSSHFYRSTKYFSKWIEAKNQ